MKFYELWKVLDKKEQSIVLRAGKEAWRVDTKYRLPKTYDENEVKSVKLGSKTVIEVEV